MRIAIAGFNLEAVTFLPDPTTRSDFERRALRGPGLVSGLKGTASVGAGFLSACEEADAVPIGIVYTNGGATGSTTTDAFDYYLAEIADAILSLLPKLDRAPKLGDSTTYRRPSPTLKRNSPAGNTK